MSAGPEVSSQTTAAGAPTDHQAGCAATTGGTAVAVAAVPSPERRNDEAHQQLELAASYQRGDVPAPTSVRIIWLAQ